MMKLLPLIFLFTALLLTSILCQESSSNSPQKNSLPELTGIEALPNWCTSIFFMDFNRIINHPEFFSKSQVSENRQVQQMLDLFVALDIDYKNDLKSLYYGWTKDKDSLSNRYVMVINASIDTEKIIEMMKRQVDENFTFEKSGDIAIFHYINKGQKVAIANNFQVIISSASDMDGILENVTKPEKTIKTNPEMMALLEHTKSDMVSYITTDTIDSDVFKEANRDLVILEDVLGYAITFSLDEKKSIFKLSAMLEPTSDAQKMRQVAEQFIPLIPDAELSFIQLKRSSTLQTIIKKPDVNNKGQVVTAQFAITDEQFEKIYDELKIDKSSMTSSSSSSE